jgi:DNA polymerase I-like protein with 3'-5' exonuclease and polymerase domains
MGFLDDLETCEGKKPSLPLCGKCKIKHSHSKEIGKSYQGYGKKGILLVMSQVETCEDSQGGLWLSDDSLSGYVLSDFKNMLEMSGLDIEEDCWRVNAVQCAPRDCDSPHIMASADCCRPALLTTIKKLKPHTVILFDSVAVKTYFGDRCGEHYPMMVDSWEGFRIPDFENNCFVYPSYGCYTLSQHTNHRNGAYVKKDTYKIVHRHIMSVLSKAIKNAERGTTVTPPNYFKKAMSLVTVDTDSQQAIAFLSTIVDGDTVAFDYETSGSKPDYPNHFIKCVSVYSKALHQCHAFMIDTREKQYDEVRKELSRILKSSKIAKIGQNIKHEQRWTKTWLHHTVKGWKWDCMLASHALYSSKSHVTGLKFQVSVNFGIFKYNDKVEKSFGIEKDNIGCGGNVLIGIDNINPIELLKYCALDSVLTYWLYERQFKELSKWKQTLEGDVPSHLDGVDFLMKSILVFAEMEDTGAYIDMDYLKKQETHCEERIKTLGGEFCKTGLYKKWRKEFGNKTNIGSGAQLGHMLYSVLNLKQKKKTESGENSTDKEALLSLGVPDLKPLASMKLFQKARGTYIEQIKREVCECLIRASFNLNTVASFRSSSNSPNLQNTPIRDKDIGIIIRGAYVSRFGKKGIILEADLKGAEVSGSACYHKDPKFMEYISSSKNDMHKDTMALVLECGIPQIDKNLRQLCKNKFVFPEFYGDWYKSCAEAIWPEMQKLCLADGMPVLEHLASVGMLKLPKQYKKGTILTMEEYPTQFGCFEEHMKEVEDKFWNEMFPVYTAWKDSWYKKYLRNGFVDSLTGFRYTGVLDRKQTINYPIQGTAYHLNQKGLNMMQSYLKKSDMQTVAFNQIHDSQLFDTVEDELPIVVKHLNMLMNKRLREIYTWINVPIVVEFERTDVGQSWFHKKPFDLETMEFFPKGA